MGVIQYGLFIIVLMITNKRLLIGYKLFFGLLGLSAVVTEIATLVERGTFNTVNFFSYFTVETNLIVAVVLVLSAVALAWGKSATFDAVRGAATVYSLIVGLGFAILLSGMAETEFTAVPWDNIVLHYIMPAVMFVDWLIDRPRRKLLFKPALAWLLFPIAYVSYTLTRGMYSDWYPYAFLDPATNGYWAVAGMVTGFLILALALTWLVTKLSGKR